MTDQPVEFFWPSDDLLEEFEFNTPMMSAREGSLHFVNSASQAAGLHYRALADTARDTLEWWHQQPADRRANPRRWSSAELERQVIARIKQGG